MTTPVQKLEQLILSNRVSTEVAKEILEIVRDLKDKPQPPPKRQKVSSPLPIPCDGFCGMGCRAPDYCACNR